jgi:type II secretory pathway pseudopilin PulG
VSLRLRRRKICFSAFTLFHLLLLVCVVGLVLFLAFPTFQEHLHKRELDRSMYQARELYIAAFDMATEGAAKFDVNRAWPGDYEATTLADYCSKLVRNGHLKVADLQRILSAPGATCTVTAVAGGVTLTGRSAIKLYRVKREDPSNTIFAASSNYVYDTALNPAATPFGDNGFVVVRKSGDLGVYRKHQATPAGFDNNPTKFQSELGIGMLPGAVEGTVVPGDGATVLIGP